MNNAIRKLKNGKSAGPDKVPTTIIKDVGDLTSKRLTKIFNSSLMTGVFPDISKLPELLLLSNQVLLKDINKYRPISVISVFSRILEGLVHGQLYEFRGENKATTRNQPAFQKLYSTVTSPISSADS